MGRLGLPQPVSVIGNNDSNVKLIVNLAEEEGEELSVYAWQSLQTIANFTTVAAELQGSIQTIAPGFKTITGSTMWNRTGNNYIDGSLSPATWQALASRNVAGPFNQFRIRGNNLYLMPAPPAGDQYYFEYTSGNWILDQDGSTTKSTFVEDTDEVLFDDGLFKNGVIVRFLRFNGLEYAQKFDDYERMKLNLQANDGGRPKITDQLWCNEDDCPPFGAIIPDGNWNQ